jgi:molecular chaperone DnaJ
MSLPNHYQTLEVGTSASQVEIKQAYRRLAKRFHPDSRSEFANHERITHINQAYEVLGDPSRRQAYDSQRQQVAQLEAAGFSAGAFRNRQQRTADVQQQYRQRRQTSHAADAQFDQWIRQVYRPVNRRINQILKPLRSQIRDLSADPFDDELMGNFEAYLEDCRSWLEDAQSTFQSMPNPGNVASVAAHLYYCLNQLEDGIEELERFTMNYDDSYLHTGQELFRISAGLKREAQEAIKGVL